MSAPIARLSGVAKVFGSDSGSVTAVRNLDLSFQRGELVAVMGRSGCGKSTVLNMLAGNERPTAGTVEFKGAVVSGPDRARGMIFQDDTLLPFRTVIDNVYWPVELRARQQVAGSARLLVELRSLSSRRREARRQQEIKADDQLRVHQALKLVGMEAFAEKWPRELSGGMRKRVELARAFAQRAELLLMDEPFAKLDAFTREEMHLLVEKFWRESACTLIFVTHDWNEAVRLADRVVVLTDRPARVGKVIPVNLPRPRTFEVVSSPAFGQVAAEIHEAVRTMEAGDAKPSTVRQEAVK
jgi:NitT/TauT family transport system ATP-binding protein